jgi:hypothetical protein
MKNSDQPIKGLTKREYFAGLALQGLLSDTNVRGTGTEIIKASVLYADALLEKLDK